MTESPDLGDLDFYQTKDPQQALDAALSSVRSYCGWHIAPSRSDTVTLWSPDGCALFLPTLNLTAVTSVTQDAVLVDPATYTFERYGVIRRTPGKYFSTLTKVTVVFVHGYTTMPDDVAAVVLGLAQRSISDTRGLVTTATGTAVVRGAEGFGPQFTKADEARLAPYDRSAGTA